MLLHPIVLCSYREFIPSNLNCRFPPCRPSTFAVDSFIVDFRPLLTQHTVFCASTCDNQILLQPAMNPERFFWRLRSLTPPGSHLSLMASLALHRRLPQTSSWSFSFTHLFTSHHPNESPYIYMCFEPVLLVGWSRTILSRLGAFDLHHEAFFRAHTPFVNCQFFCQSSNETWSCRRINLFTIDLSTSSSSNFKWSIDPALFLSVDCSYQW